MPRCRKLNGLRLLVAVATLGLMGCYDTATVRDGRLRDEAILTVSAPRYSGPLARGLRKMENCPNCGTFEATVPMDFDTGLEAVPVSAVRIRNRLTPWLMTGISVVTTGMFGASIMARLRLLAGGVGAIAVTGKAGFGVSPVAIPWWNHVSLDASVDPLDWLSVYASPHLGQMGAALPEYVPIGTNVWGVNGGLRWQLGGVVALYTEVGWTRSCETDHSVLTPTLGVAYDIPDRAPK